MRVLAVCGWCALRYSGVVHPQCKHCAGIGLIAANEVDGMDPLVTLRAVVMAMNEGVSRQDLAIRFGLLGDPTSAVGLEKTPQWSDAASVGRAAGKFLLAKGIRQPKERRKPTRKTKAEKEAERQQLAAAEASWAAHREKREQEQREAEARQAALEALAERHEEELADEIQTQELFGVLDRGFRGFTPTVVQRGRGKL